MNDWWEEIELPEGYYLMRAEPHDFLQIVPRPSDDELAEYYANAYLNPCIHHNPEGIADIVCRFRCSGRVLDIGCGRGELLEVFLQRGWKTVGVEPNQEYAWATRRNGSYVFQDTLTEKVLQQAGVFDAVLLVNVLEHLAYPEDMLDMVWRLLKPKGIFYCDVPNDFNALQEVAVNMYDLQPWWIALPDHLNYFSIESLVSFVADYGFEILLETTDFPMELFLLWGDNYVNDAMVGSQMHIKRCLFEQAMQEAGKGKLLCDIYEALAKLGIGRRAIVCARKP